MDNLTFCAEMLHKHRAAELQETARIERFLHEMKKRESSGWQGRRLHRSQKLRD